MLRKHHAVGLRAAAGDDEPQVPVAVERVALTAIDVPQVRHGDQQPQRHHEHQRLVVRQVELAVILGREPVDRADREHRGEQPGELGQHARPVLARRRAPVEPGRLALRDLEQQQLAHGHERRGDAAGEHRAAQRVELPPADEEAEA